MYRLISSSHKMFIHTCTEHSSITPPVNETQEYDYQYQDKGTDQVWNFRDDICRTES